MRFVCFIVMTILLAAYSPAGFAENSTDDYKVGSRLYREGKYEQAIPYFENACKDDSTDKAEAHYLLANCYIHLKKNDKAIEHYKQSYFTNQHGLHAHHCIAALKRLRKLKKKTGGLKAKKLPQEKKTEEATDKEIQPTPIQVEIEDKGETKESTREELIANKVNNLIGRGNDLIFKKRLKEGEKLLIEALHTADRLGSKSLSLCKALEALVSYNNRIQDDEKAAQLLERQQRVTIAMYGRFSKETAMVTRDLAHTYDHANKYGPARTAYIEYVDEWETLYRRWKSTHLNKYKDAKKELRRAYRDAADFFDKHGDESLSDLYVFLAQQLANDP